MAHFSSKIVHFPFSYHICKANRTKCILVTPWYWVAIIKEWERIIKNQTRTTFLLLFITLDLKIKSSHNFIYDMQCIRSAYLRCAAPSRNAQVLVPKKAEECFHLQDHLRKGCWYQVLELLPVSSSWSFQVSVSYICHQKWSQWISSPPCISFLQIKYRFINNRLIYC